MHIMRIKFELVSVVAESNWKFETQCKYFCDFWNCIELVMFFLNHCDVFGNQVLDF